MHYPLSSKFSTMYNGTYRAFICAVFVSIAFRVDAAQIPILTRIVDCCSAAGNKFASVQKIETGSVSSTQFEAAPIKRTGYKFRIFLARVFFFLRGDVTSACTICELTTFSIQRRSIT